MSLAGLYVWFTLVALRSKCRSLLASPFRLVAAVLAVRYVSIVVMS